MKHPLIKPLCHAVLATLITFSGQLAAQHLSATTTSIAPSKTVQAPGYFRTQLGTMQVTALFDGNLPLPAAIFKGTTLNDTHKR
jgi:hypothetical protein